MDDAVLSVEILSDAEGRCQLRVTKVGNVDINSELQADLYAYAVTLTLPPDKDGRPRIVTKRVIHYEPHGWRRLLAVSIAAVL